MTFDRFEIEDEAAASNTIDPETARRQFNMSAGLAVVLAIAALVIGVLGPIKTVSVPREAAQTIVQAPQIVHIRHAESTIRTPGS